MDTKKEYKPFPVGTLRGPFKCGIGHDAKGRIMQLPDQGVQFCVKAVDGGWRYFTEHVTQEAKAHREAEAFKAAVMLELTRGI